MPGERVVLAGGAEGNAARLVHAAARLADAGLGHYALIGGLAVMCRLAAVHRATQDIDTVTESTTPTALEVIASSVGSMVGSGQDRAVIDGISIDVIETGRFSDDDLDGVDVADQLFVVSHRWALDTASPTELVAGGAVASIRVATPSALVAMKAGALLGGRTRAPHKRASDLYDLYRLLLDHDTTGSVSDALGSAPHNLGDLVGRALQARVIDEPERAVRWLMGGGPEMSNTAPDDLTDVVLPVVQRLRS